MGSWSTSLASCHRRRPCGRACSPSAGVTSESPPQACASSPPKGKFLGSANKLLEFVEHLLRGRGGSPLDLCDLRLGDFADKDWFTYEDVLRCLNHWIRHAVGCKVQVLRLRIHCNEYLELEEQPLVSQHLRGLEIGRVQFYTGLLDSSGCLNLEYMEFESCHLLPTSASISFQSLKHLRTIGSAFFLNSLDSRIRIYAPNLISLDMDKLFGFTPIFESLSSLMEASVTIHLASSDHCNQWNGNYRDRDCKSCGDIADDGNRCVLLKGLSEAKSLKLVSEPTMFIFKRDMRWCPTFSKLKNLWLNDSWCVPDDFRALACILEHSPVLEKLTLQLFFKAHVFQGPKHKVEMKGSISPTERSTAIPEHLKTVEVKCEAVDVRILKILKFLHVCNICKRTCFTLHASMFLILLSPLSACEKASTVESETP